MPIKPTAAAMPNAVDCSSKYPTAKAARHAPAMVLATTKRWLATDRDLLQDLVHVIGGAVHGICVYPLVRGSTARAPLAHAIDEALEHGGRGHCIPRCYHHPCSRLRNHAGRVAARDQSEYRMSGEQ